MVVLAEALQAWKSNPYSEYVSIPVKTVSASSVMKGFSVTNLPPDDYLVPPRNGTILVPQHLVSADKQVANSSGSRQISFSERRPRIYTSSQLAQLFCIWVYWASTRVAEEADTNRIGYLIHLITESLFHGGCPLDAIVWNTNIFTLLAHSRRPIHIPFSQVPLSPNSYLVLSTFFSVQPTC